MLTIILISLLTIVIGYKLGALAWKYHVTQLRLERDKRNQNYTAAKILADNLEVVVFARDYYRAALIEITRVSPSHEPAGEIARRFLSTDQSEAA